jgi:DMSO/TMAO reductase YedYZ molybdopterin-dependent catalytic subunit
MRADHMRRRQFFVSAVGAAGATATLGLRSSALAQEAKPLPAYAAWKDAEDIIFHTAQTLEMKRGAAGTSGITASSDLYVRNNLPAPAEEIVADRDAWSLVVEGVRNPRTMTLAELKSLGLDTVAMVLQCSGNGRAYFDHEASGTRWTVGAAGNLLWSGVPVPAVVEALGGVEDGRKFMTGTGGEPLPQGVEPKTVLVERSLPLAAMEQALLAWEMNGEPLSVAHGGPLRLVTPGYYGVNNIKYIKRLAFTETESDAAIQQTGYRVRPVGVKGAPSQPSMWDMPVKSWVTHPLMEASTGRVQIHGVAFGGMHAVRQVEVSTDGGQTWQEARFVGPDLGRFAWRPFVLAADLKAGTHTIASRATDMEGNVQPEAFEPNERGYGHNGWRAHAVEVTVG